MCKVKTPSYTAPATTEYRDAKSPDNAGMYEAARAKQSESGGGSRRKTYLSALSSMSGMTASRSGTARAATTLG